MKKRSQSSLRAKTLQSEDDRHENQYWIGSLPASKRSSYSKYSSSMVKEQEKEKSMNIENLDPNKENECLNSWQG